MEVITALQIVAYVSMALGALLGIMWYKIYLKKKMGD
jgi:hypothetical protein